MKKKIFILSFILLSCGVFGQETNKPKLVIGVVVDQMRAEYLHRFKSNYSENGFKKLMREGFVLKNMHYNYIPTATGPGHATIFTGTTPKNHGIVANDWYDKSLKRTVYCAEDNGALLIGERNVGTENIKFARSPKNLLSNTITDELKLYSNRRSKVVGISLKDRGAILPAGHLADYAFWFNTNTGNFITSSYYTKQLPEWMVRFNNQMLSDSLLDLTWDTYLPIKDYTNSIIDDAKYEKVFLGKKNSTFPYKLKELRTKNKNFELIPQVPYGNTLLTHLAKAAIEGENMGKGRFIDFLSISYSSTDYVGHGFGIRSKEVEDTYVRLDRELAQLLLYLDKNLGKDNYLFFLTADHGASDQPKFLKDSRLRGNFYDLQEIRKVLNTELSKIWGDNEWISHIDKAQVYLNFFNENKYKIIESASDILSQIEGIAAVYIPFKHESRTLDIDRFFKNSYHNKNSGDILFQFDAGYMPKRKFGTTHGNAYNDDTNVPMLWYGLNIYKGLTVKKYTIDQIAPTLSFLLDIPLPNTANNQPILELFKEKY